MKQILYRRDLFVYRRDFGRERKTDLAIWRFGDLTI
jgi:hypothetical protein